MGDPAEKELAQLRLQVQQLTDRAEISDLVSRLGLLLDEKRFDDIRSVVTDDVVADFPSYAAAGQLRGSDDLAAHGLKSQGRFARAQHVMTNVLIDLDGDRASVRANLIATHVHQADESSSHYDIGEYYRLEVVRTPAGWRISRLNPNAIWSAGTRPPVR
mgnify:CR=1 FL=1